MANKKFYWLAVLIFFFAFILRFYKLGQIPVSLYWDEAAILADAKIAAATGLDQHGRPWYQLLYPSYGDYKLPVYIWLATLAVKIFGANEFAVRLPSALAGLGTVIVGALLVRQLFPKLSRQDKNLLSLSVMLILTINPWSLMFSRVGFEGHLAQFLVAVSIYLSLSIPSPINRRGLGRGASAVFFGTLATYTYFSVRFVWPIVFFATLCLTPNPSPINRRGAALIMLKRWGEVLLAITFYFLLLLPMLRSPLYATSQQFRLSADSIFNAHNYPLQANIYRKISGYSLIDRVFWHRHLLLIKELAKNYADHLDLRFLFVTGDPNLRHGTGQHGLFLLFFLPIFFCGLYQLFKENKKVLLFLFVWWMIALLPASVPETTPHALRSINALLPLAIIIAFGLFGFLKLKIKNLKLVMLIFYILLSINLISFLNHYFIHYPKQSAYDWQDGYKEMAQLVSAYRHRVTTVWAEAPEDRWYLWLLAFGDFTPQEIQATPKRDFKMQSLGNIVFEHFDWEKIASLDHDILVISEAPKAKEKIAQFALQPKEIKKISTGDGVERWWVVYYEK